MEYDADLAKAVARRPASGRCPGSIADRGRSRCWSTSPRTARPRPYAYVTERFSAESHKAVESPVIENALHTEFGTTQGGVTGQR